MLPEDAGSELDLRDYLSVVRRQQSNQVFEQHTFSSSTSPNDDDPLPAVDFQVHTIENALPAETLVQVPYFDHVPRIRFSVRVR